MSNVVIGISASKNGFSSARPLDLTGLDGLVVIDADYFKAHMAEVLRAVLREPNALQDVA
jgi:phage FluMu gp28-like protein